MVIIATTLSSRLMSFLTNSFQDMLLYRITIHVNTETESMDWNIIKNNQLDKTFTIKKVKAAFSHMGSFKLAGPDGIKPIVMKIVGPRALGCITNIFQAIYSTGYIPIELRKSRVVFIPKPQKDDYGMQGHLDPYLLLNFYLNLWSVSLSGYSENMPTNSEKFPTCNMHTVALEVQTLPCQL